MPTGGSTEVQEVEVVRQDLSLDMSCTNFDYDAVVQALAVQYDIDSSLISFDDPCASASRRRGRKLASLRITIEIATPPPDLSGSAPVTTAAKKKRSWIRPHIRTHTTPSRTQPLPPSPTPPPSTIHTRSPRALRPHSSAHR